MKKFKRDVEKVVSVVLCILFLSGQTCFAVDQYMAGPPSCIMEAAPPGYQVFNQSLVDAGNAAEAGLTSTPTPGTALPGPAAPSVTPQPTSPANPVTPSPTPTSPLPTPQPIPTTPPTPLVMAPTHPPPLVTPPTPPTPPVDLSEPPEDPPDPPEPPDLYDYFPPPLPPGANPPIIIEIPEMPVIHMPMSQISIFYDTEGFTVYYDIYTWNPSTNSYDVTTYSYTFTYPPPPPSPYHIPYVLIDTDGDGIPDTYVPPGDIG